MSKFVHVTADRVHSGMQRLEQLDTDDSSRANREQFERRSDEIRVQRDHDYEAKRIAQDRDDAFDPHQTISRGDND